MARDRPSSAAQPRATLRLQFHKAFGFDQARAWLPYFARLGISHIYASPILSARAGSLHGYDVVDHGAVNPELGGEEALRRLVAALRELGMGLIVDIVPNHMAVGRGDNRWWLDVLEWGRDSRYAGFFDIDWDVPDPALRGRLLAPFLGRPYGEALDAGELALRLDAAAGKLYCAYYDHRFPLAPRDYAPLLRLAGEPLLALASRFRQAAAQRGEAARRAAVDAACAQLAENLGSPGARQAIESLLQRYDAAQAEGRERLHRLLERQHYRLAWWRSANDEINWRRFFDVIELAALRVQEPAAFEAVHATVFRLYAEGLIDGLRVDHVDGLADPRAYCRKLRARLAELAPQRPPAAPRGPAYLVVEKILAPGEPLPLDWRVDGTSGYAFMNEVGALLHDATGEAPLRELWHQCSGRSAHFEDEERLARRRIAQELLGADFNACAHALHQLARADLRTRDWSLNAVRRVLLELLVSFPVYRTYADGRGRSAADRELMQRAVAAARPHCWPAERTLLDPIDRWLGGEPPAAAHGAAERRARLRALARFQQLTPPLAAKAVEDTAFYRHGTLLSRNEVGADPGQFAMPAERFHQACAARLRRYPHAMLATATHDHKRGEDLRARLAVLSEVPRDWQGTVSAWIARNAALKPEREGVKGPDATDEYMLYQMLLGAWPLQLAPDDAAGLAAFCDRIAGWQQKAVREAKRRSGWTEPNLPYEDACDAFLRALLDPQRPTLFLAELQRFVDGIAAAGARNGLAQTLLRMTTPGVPDLYQGCERWDFSLVDPDNRQPVDFAARAAFADDADDTADAELLSHWRDGRIKQRLIQCTLALRAQDPELFTRGRYLPLRVVGVRADRILAFLRELDGRVALVAVPRLSLGLAAAGSFHLGSGAWGDTALELPQALCDAGWCDVLGGAAASAAAIRAADLFRHWPVALLSRLAPRSESNLAASPSRNR